MAALPPRLLSGTVVSTAGRVVGTAISILTISVVTRGLAAIGGVAAYGAYAAVFAVLAVLAVVADSGLYLVFTRAAARLTAGAESGLLRRILHLRVGTFLGAFLVIALLVPLLPYPTVVHEGILLGAVGVFCQLVSQITMGVYQKRLRMLVPAVAEVLGRALTLVLAVAAARQGAGPLMYVGAFVAGALGTTLIHLAGARRLLRAAGDVAGLHPPSHSALMRAAWPLGLMLMLWLIVFRADSVILSILRPPEDLGWYTLPYKVLESLLFFPAMIGGLMFPTLARAAGESAVGATAAAFGRTLEAAVRLFLGLAIPLVLVLFLSAPWVIAVLGGPPFAPSTPVLRILAVALGALFFGNLFGSSAIALGVQWPLLGVAALLAGANVAVNLVVIPRYSFLGAAWTTLATETLSAASAAWIVLRRLPRLSLAPQAWHIFSAGGLFLAVGALPIHPLARAAFGLFVYVAALLVLGVVQPRGLSSLFRAQRVSSAP